MWKKLMASIAGSILVSSCQTSMYKPIICEPGTALKNGRCQKVPPIEKRTVATPAVKKKVVKPKTDTTAPRPFVSQPAFIPPKRDNGYTN